MAFHEQDPIGARARGEPQHAWGQTDLVFDFSGIAAPDAGSMGLVLTARLLAEEQHRRVWVRAMPDPAWRLLDALGLGHLFELFPNGGGFRN